jgi:hypothetical protein
MYLYLSQCAPYLGVRGIHKKMNLFRISILFSALCLGIAIGINYHITLDYLTASGKTRALFGLANLDRLDSSILGLIGLIIGFISLIKAAPASSKAGKNSKTEDSFLDLIERRQYLCKALTKPYIGEKTYEFNNRVERATVCRKFIPIQLNCRSSKIFC